MRRRVITFDYFLLFQWKNFICKYQCIKPTSQGCVCIFFIKDVTLSALNAPESDVDIEGDSSSSKRLDFDSGKKKLFKLLAF